jgi:hypothetical protein
MYVGPLITSPYITIALLHISFSWLYCIYLHNLLNVFEYQIIRCMFYLIKGHYVLDIYIVRIIEANLLQKMFLLKYKVSYTGIPWFLRIKLFKLTNPKNELYMFCNKNNIIDIWHTD